MVKSSEMLLDLWAPQREATNSTASAAASPLVFASFQQLAKFIALEPGVLHNRTMALCVHSGVTLAPGSAVVLDAKSTALTL